MSQNLTTFDQSEISQPKWKLSQSDFDRIDYIFTKMETRYGTQWAEKWAGINVIQVMENWAEDLSDISDLEIAEGVAASRDLKFPPSLCEFRQLCKSNFRETPANHPMYKTFTPVRGEQSQETQEIVKKKIEEMKAKLRGNGDE